ncbi:MAG: DUF2007 domain-containing protein [Chitinophagales bacterium]
MEKDWMMVFTTTDKVRADFVKSVLEDNQILVVLFNKTDNPYTDSSFRGIFELYVHWKQAEEALEHIYNLPE